MIPFASFAGFWFLAHDCCRRLDVTLYYRKDSFTLTKQSAWGFYMCIVPM